MSILSIAFASLFFVIPVYRKAAENAIMPGEFQLLCSREKYG